MQRSAIPETSPSPWPLTRAGIKCWAWAFLFGAASRWSFVLFERRAVPEALAIGIAAATAILGILCFYYLWRWIAGLDELQRSLQLRALALVFPGFLLVVVACDQLRAAKVVDGFSWHVQECGFAMLAVYGLSWTWLWWRNR
jgi:hypothetical protein